jgi:hypothetical protein
VADLDATISGTIVDQSANSLSNFTPTTPLATNKNLVLDNTAPVLSGLLSDPSSTTANISWTTNEAASSQIIYGLVSTYGLQTTETDTSPKVTSHTVALSNLYPCARYYYYAKSKDAAGNEGSPVVGNFTTSGCAVSTVSGGNESAVASSGGTLSLTNNQSTVTLTAPNNWATQSAALQINKLATASTPLAPTGKSLVKDNFYNLVSEVATFAQPITFVITYGADAESEFVESTLDVYKYANSSWTKQNCTLNTTANTLTCLLNSFSVYAVYGELPTTASSGSVSPSVSSSSPSPPACNNSSPVGQPDLFQIDVSPTQALLYFTPVKNVSEYVVAFGNFGGTFKTVQSDGVVTLLISHLTPNTSYPFKVRGGNGCATGAWSNEKNVTTLGYNLEAPTRQNLCTHTVLPGDTLWTIAQKTLGGGKLYPKIVEKNFSQYPEIEMKLKVGSVLKLPCEDQEIIPVPVHVPTTASASPKTKIIPAFWWLVFLAPIPLITFWLKMPKRKRRLWWRRLKTKKGDKIY